MHYCKTQQTTKKGSEAGRSEYVSYTSITLQPDLCAFISDRLGIYVLPWRNSHARLDSACSTQPWIDYYDIA